MSDRMAATIYIGGKIKDSLLAPLAKAIEAAGVSKEMGEGGIDFDSAMNVLSVAAAKKETASFCMEAAAWGEFPDLEKFCLENRIHYDRHSEAKYEYVAMTSKSRGDGKYTDVSDSEDGETILAIDVREILASRKSPKSKLAAIDKLLDKTPALEPLQIIAG